MDKKGLLVNFVEINIIVYMKNVLNREIAAPTQFNESSIRRLKK